MADRAFIFFFEPTAVCLSWFAPSLSVRVVLTGACPVLKSFFACESEVLVSGRCFITGFKIHPRVGEKTIRITRR